MRAILGEQKRPIKINNARALRYQHCRRHRQRCRHHAADHDDKAPVLSLHRKRERLGETACFVEFDVDRIVFAAQRIERCTIMDALVGANRNRARDLRELSVVTLRQGLLDKRNARFGAGSRR